jgi:hypothetical protein
MSAVAIQANAFIAKPAAVKPRTARTVTQAAKSTWYPGATNTPKYLDGSMPGGKFALNLKINYCNYLSIFFLVYLAVGAPNRTIKATYCRLTQLAAWRNLSIFSYNSLIKN